MDRLDLWLSSISATVGPGPLLNFEINRAGRGLSNSRRQVLERAKEELRKLYGRDPAEARRKPHAGKTHHRARPKKGA
jgi:hypothetical protein